MNDIEKPDRVAAHRRAETIRSGIAGFAEAKTAIAEAFEAHDWITLGYTTWGDYCKKEIGNRLKMPRADRDLAIQAFRELGMSVREIAEALELAKSTVQDALKPPPPKPSGSGHLTELPADPLDDISDEAKAAIQARLAEQAAVGETPQLPQEPPIDRSGPQSAAGVADDPSRAGDGEGRSEPDHRDPHPGADDAGPSSSAQPPTDSLGESLGDEVDAQGPSPEGPSAPADERGPQDRAGVSPPAVPVSGKEFEEFLDEHVPDGDPHQKWRASFLKAIRQSYALSSFAVNDIAANGNELCFDELINLRDFMDGLLSKVQARRVELKKQADAELPANVTPIRRPA